MKLTPRIEEVVIGAVLGAGTGMAVGALALVLLRQPLPTLWLPSLSTARFMVRTVVALIDLLAIAGAIAGGWIATTQPDIEHVSGVEFIGNPRQARRALQELEREAMSEEQQRGAVHGVEIAGLQLSRARELTGALIVAAPDSGKSTLLIHVEAQAITRGDRVVIHDPKSELAVTHLDPSNTVLLGPWDARAALLDPGDIDAPALADAFADSICNVAGAAGQNVSFHQSAAAVLAGAIKTLMAQPGGWTWAGLGRVLEMPTQDLARFAAGEAPAVQKAIPSAFIGGEPTTGERAVISILDTSARTLIALAAVDAGRPDAPRFSVRGWLSGRAHLEIRRVILNSSGDYPQACEGLWGYVLGLTKAELPKLPSIGADAPGVWLLLDELPQLGASAIAEIQRIAELGRSKGLRVWSVLQNEGQVAAKVGQAAAVPVLDMPSLRIYLKMSTPAAAGIAARYGKRQVRRFTTTGSAGSVIGKTAQPDTLPVIDASVLSGLRVRRRVGVELVVGDGALLGRLLQRFDPKLPKVAEGIEPCPYWRAGRPAPVAAAPQSLPLPEPSNRKPDRDAGSDPTPLPTIDF